MSKSVDYVVPNGLNLEAVKANGYDAGIIRYLGGWGRLLPEERDHARALGLPIALVWEQNEGDPLQGAGLGEAQARQAAAEANALFPGGGGVVFMACDTDPRRNRAASVDYYRASAPIIRAGGNAHGAYLGDDPGVQLLDEGTLDYLWQPAASSWSAVFPSPRAHLVQRVGMPVDLGGDYDHNDVLSHYGAWGATGGFLMALNDAEQQELLDVARLLRDGAPGFGVPPVSVSAARANYDLAGILSAADGKPSTRELLVAIAAATPDGGDGSDEAERQRLAEARDNLRSLADGIDAFLGA